MRVNIQAENPRQKIFLKAEGILRFLIGEDEKLEKIIVLENSKYIIITDDNELYKAICSLKGYDEFPVNKLKKLLEVATIESYYGKFGKTKSILKEEELEKIRKNALKGGN